MSPDLLTAVNDHVADTEARICALNVHNPGPQRAHKLVDWLIATVLRKSAAYLPNPYPAFMSVEP